MAPSTTKPTTVFVTSATGLVGTAICTHLLSNHYLIRATTRDLSSPAAKALSSKGVSLTHFSWDDDDDPSASSQTTTTLLSALQGCTKLYLSILPTLRNPSILLSRAKRILTFAREAGIAQVVALTSLGAAMVESGYPFPESAGAMVAMFESYREVEDLVAAYGFESWTVIRSGFFMGNFLEPKVRWGFVGSIWESGEGEGDGEGKGKGVWKTSMARDSLLGLSDHVTMAKVVAAAFADPAGWDGKKIGLVSDGVRVQEALDVLSDVICDGRVLRAEFRTDEDMASAPAAGEWMIFPTQKFVRDMADYVTLVAEVAAMVPG
jgi:nucleoside-diphosphate-sugar epimerase